jgi:hypothetical protein
VQPSDAAVGNKRKKGSSSSHSKKAKAAAKTPTQALVPHIKGELRSYQLKGVSWLISLWTNGMNGILADQMGLGKTVQTIAFLSHLRDNGIMGPFLIVVPLSTLVNWKEEVSRWCPGMSAIIYHGSKADRQAIERQWFKPAYNRANLLDVWQNALVVNGVMDLYLEFYPISSKIFSLCKCQNGWAVTIDTEGSLIWTGAFQNLSNKSCLSFFPLFILMIFPDISVPRVNPIKYPVFLRQTVPDMAG